MISVKNNFKAALLLFCSAVIILSACNKDVEQFPETAPPSSSGPTLGESIAANPSYSLFNALVIRSGLQGMINNKAATYTMFVTDNNAMKLFVNAVSGGLVPL